MRKNSYLISDPGAKIQEKNFKKMNNNHIKCILGCQQDEDQQNTFFQCSKLVKKNNLIKYEQIFGPLSELEAITMCASIELTRKHIMKNPGERAAGTLAHLIY